MRVKTGVIRKNLNGYHPHPPQKTISRLIDISFSATKMYEHSLGACPHPEYIRDLQTGEIIPINCNKWTCPYCGHIKKAKLLDNIAYGGAIIQANGRRWRFLTLTLSTRVDGRKIDLFWARFRANIHAWAKKTGQHTPQYFKIKEFTEKGQRHLHVLIDTFLPFNMIQYFWRMATDGTSYWVNIKKAQVKSAAGYMSKYMTKQTVLSDLFDKGERRYSFSYHFPRIPRPIKVKGERRYEHVSRVELMYEQIDAGTYYETDPHIPRNLKVGRHATIEELKSIGYVDIRRETSIRKADRRQSTSGEHQQQACLP